jgi:hypothetical protein
MEMIISHGILRSLYLSSCLSAALELVNGLGYCGILRVFKAKPVRFDSRAHQGQYFQIRL